MGCSFYVPATLCLLSTYVVGGVYVCRTELTVYIKLSLAFPHEPIYLSLYLLLFFVTLEMGAANARRGIPIYKFNLYVLPP
jgi:hypothetical protein